MHAFLQHCSVTNLLHVCIRSVLNRDQALIQQNRAVTMASVTSPFVASVSGWVLGGM